MASEILYHACPKKLPCDRHANFELYSTSKSFVLGLAPYLHQRQFPYEAYAIFPLLILDSLKEL